MGNVAVNAEFPVEAANHRVAPHCSFMPSIVNVCDDRSTRQAMGRFLKVAGFDVTDVRHGSGIVDLILRCNPHLALINVHNSPVDSSEICHRIRNHPQTAALPIICITKTPLGLENMPARLAGGADVYLEESSGPLALIATIRSVIQLRLANRIARDAEHKLAEAEMLVQSHRDNLTDLPDRAGFGVSLTRALAAATISGDGVAVCYLDLDGFKLMSRRLDGRYGDQILVVVARRLRELALGSDCIARVGGDEFAFFGSGGGEPAVQLSAEQILGCFNDPFLVYDDEVFLTATAGVSVYPQDGENCEQLMQSAEAAMYQARKSGKNRWQAFTTEMAFLERDRRNLERQLRSASYDEEFSLHYQPEVNLATRKVVRYEALLQWQHPRIGAVAPSRFIPIAEESGLIVEIGAWVLRQACRDAICFSDPKARVAVNVSAVQLLRPTFVDVVKEALGSAGLRPQRLEIELTGSVPIDTSPEVLAVMHRLRALGVGISIDNFGTGQVSLRSLRSLPLTGLKIDRIFAARLGADPSAKMLVQSIVLLAHSLGLSATSAGIETEDQMNAALDVGCDEAQGFYFGHPVPLEGPSTRAITALRPV